MRPGAGFSLIELVIVVTIIAILAAMAIPRFGNSIARQRAEAAACRVAADLKLARRHAIQTSATQTVTFELSSSSYVLEGMRHLDHPDSTYRVQLSAEPYMATLTSADFDDDAEVVFDIYGTPDSSGNVVVRVGDWVKTVKLEAETGRIEVE